MKAIRCVGNDEGLVGPSYSGLMPFNKESYFPPVSISPEATPKNSVLIKEGGVPLILIPIKGDKGLIRISPVMNVSSKTLARLDIISEQLQPILDVLSEIDYLKNQVEVVVASAKATSNISNIMMDYGSIIRGITEICIRTIRAAGGFYLDDSGDPDYVVFSGIDAAVGNQLRHDRGVSRQLMAILSGNDYAVIKKGQMDFFNIPSYFAADSIDAVILVKVPLENGFGLTGFCFRNARDVSEINEYQINALMVMTKKIGDIIANSRKVKELSESYIDMLKMLAAMMDNNSPHTVGYSELMMRFSTIVAKELNLDKKDVKEIALAAYLSNIGVLGISNSLIQKEGKYTELEYELMKLHSDVGASIVESTIGNAAIASYIRHHHERVDGFGYPSRLKGNEIPLGSRIIAVVQTFLAKINGRKGRDPLPFEKALQMLKSSEGTQLDAVVVNALIQWFNKKQAHPSRIGRPLGKCWEMRCTPYDICVQCPAYGKDDCNCWEVKGIRCGEHGNRCETCFIYTEFTQRNVSNNVMVKS
jgi:HD-GYP domain-containing protein (c-di-GMP phosphodiesterase class II)